MKNSKLRPSGVVKIGLVLSIVGGDPDIGDVWMLMLGCCDVVMCGFFFSLLS